MSLTDTSVKNLKAKEKTYKSFDSKGLYLEITPKGAKRWRFKYRFMKKEKLLSLGLYPEVSLKKARSRRDEFRVLLADGVDPSEHRKAEKNGLFDEALNTFESVGREWHSKFSSTWVDSHSNRILRRLEKDIFPWLGAKPIASLSPQDVLHCVQRIENRGAIESAHRALQNCSQIFRYGVATGNLQRDPTPDLRGALAPSKGSHFAAITEPHAVGELLRAIDAFQGTFIIKSALQFAPLVFVRPGELRTAKWEDIDFSTREWRYLVSKTETEHIVPLSEQALGILKEIRPITGNGLYVFPSLRSKQRPMSENTILAALRRMGYAKEEMSGHGFRAMARTILDEVLEFPPHLIEHQLAHAVRDPNGRAYNRTAHLEQRRDMMQKWSDYLDEIKKNNVLVQFKREKVGE